MALTFGVLGTVAVSPLSSVMLARAERLDYAYLRASAGLTAIAGGRLWLRQADRELDPQGVAILSGRPLAVRADGRAGERPGDFTLTDVSLWRLAANDRPLARIEAPRARLLPGRWALEDSVTFNADRSAGPRQLLYFPTDLTPDRIENSFASPDTLSFWALPGFIAVLERPASPRCGTSCISRACWPCRCWPPPWRCCPPASRCAPPAAAAWRR